MVPEAHGADETAEFIAPDSEGWHYTTMRDWIAVCPDVSATAARVYWIVRSLMLEKGPRERRLSLDQLCWLLPGINKKPTSETRVKDALRELEAVGLLSNPDRNVVRRWVTDPATGKQTRENFRRWQVHDFPTVGYEGPKSAFDLLESYPGPGWRDGHVCHTGTEGRKSDSQSRATRSPAKTRNSAGQTESRISAQTGRKSVARNSLTSENPAPKEVVERSNLPLPPPRRTHVTPNSAAERREEGEEPTTTDNPGAVTEMLVGIPIPAGKRRPGSRSVKLLEVAERCATILAGRDRYGLDLSDLRRHLSVDLDTVRYSITSVWLSRLNDTELPDPRPSRSTAAADEPAPAAPDGPVRDLSADELIARGLDHRFLPARLRNGRIA